MDRIWELSVKILIGDVREQLRELPEESVHCVVTSPPYWGLRDYSVDGQIGQESTLQEYVEVMVEVFHEVRRVLRKDGTVWLNLGDSYCSQGGLHDGRDDNQPGVGAKRVWRNGSGRADGIVDGRGQRNRNGNFVPSLKPKDLCMMPARVALALQADGWWLRSEIVWAKPNPMPESVTDRPTSSHEKIYLLTKSQRYYYDAEAVKEPYSDVSIARLSQPNFENQTGGPKDTLTGNRSHKKTLNNQHEKLMRQEKMGRNLRNVWTVATAPFPGAHFATFPPALIVPCIKAGTSERGCCPECGAPWIRNVTREPNPGGINGGEHREPDRDGALGKRNRDLSREKKGFGGITSGWSPSCNCGLEEVPCTVLDPFGGAGTTGLVADRLNRNAILIELNPEYADMARKRIQKDAGMFLEVN